MSICVREVELCTLTSVNGVRAIAVSGRVPEGGGGALIGAGWAWFERRLCHAWQGVDVDRGIARARRAGSSVS